MAKRELWDISWLAPVINYCQAFPVDPESADRSALKFAAQLLERGEGLVVFPEGRISESGELDEILPGAVMLALKSGVPVVPVGLSGAQYLIPYGETRARFTLRRIQVHFGEPLEFGDLEELPGREARQVARERMAEGIKKARATAGR